MADLSFLDDVEPEKRRQCEADDCDKWASGKECEGCGGGFCYAHSIVMPESLVTCEECADDASRSHISNLKLQIGQIDQELSEWRKEKKKIHKEYSDSAFLPADCEKYHESNTRINKKYGSAAKNSARKNHSKGIRALNKFRRARGLKPISDK